jgi:large subunit ribosomal protein L4
MATLPVYDRSGKEVGSYEIDPADLAPSINKQLLHDAVVMYQANLRQGTHRTKNRAAVAGSRKKMYRQKGTGNARAGHRMSGVRRGGGHMHTVRPRDYSYHLPRKALRAATRMAVASKIADEQVVVIDELAFSQPKTKDMAAILGALNVDSRSLLVATDGQDINVYKSARNIDRVSVSPVSELNALSVLHPRRVLFTKAALDAFKQSAAGGSAEAGDAESSGDSAAAPTSDESEG